VLNNATIVPNKTVLCPVCKAHQMTARCKRCRQCYLDRRGATLSHLAATKHYCHACGAEVSRGGSKTKRCRACYVKWRRDRGSASLVPESTPRIPLADFEDAWSRWGTAIGMMRERYSGPPTPRKKKNGYERVCVVPDVHAPFHEEEFLAELCAREGPISTKAIAIGDISDAYAFSTFTKYENVSFSEEWAQVTSVVQALSEAFQEVEIVIGNHDERLEKRLRERLSADQIAAVLYMTGGTLCPLTALAKHYPNVSIAKHVTPSGHSVDWFTTCGTDAWLGHPQKFSRVPAAALRAVEDWIRDHETVMGLGRPRLIVMGHTHQLAIVPFRSDTLLVECGSVCQVQSYQLSPRLGGRPQKRGYIWFEQHDGTTDLNSVGMRWFDVA